MSEDRKLMPLFLVKPKTVSKSDIRRIEKNCGIIVAECLEPDAARYSEPPIDMRLDIQYHTALQLMRSMVQGSPNDMLARRDITKFIVEMLLRESPPQQVARTQQVKK